MAKENKKSKEGFTMIEVVLVLAIAGLIFLMVFVALPALRRGQRDTQRRDDMARFASQLSQYQANNNGRVPGENDPTADDYNDFIEDYKDFCRSENKANWIPKKLRDIFKAKKESCK